MNLRKNTIRELLLYFVRPEILIVIVGALVTGLVVMFGEAHFGIQGTSPEAERESPATMMSVTTYDASAATENAFQFKRAAVEALSAIPTPYASLRARVLDAH